MIQYDERCPAVVTRLRERVRMRASIDSQLRPRLLDRADSHTFNRFLRNEMISECAGECLHALERPLAGEGVYRVLHGIGRDAQAIVAGIHRVERSFELDVERQVDEAIRLEGVAARGPHDFDEPHVRLAVPVPGNHARLRDRSSSRTG